MEVVGLAFLCLFLYVLKNVLDELWTMLQIVRNFFVRKRNLRKEYGQWAIVTGCTDGIGKAFALELARRGMDIILISRNPAKLSEVASEIRVKHGCQTKVVVADFSKGREIYHKIREEIEEADVGVLVNNVGVQYTYPMYFGELPEDELWGLLNVNIGSVVHMTRMLLPKMAARKRGAIVNLSSGSKLQPLPFMNLYAASKVFIDYYTEALRHEYRDSNLSIQCLCPYYVTTKINHFSDLLRRVNIFIPTAEAYVERAVNTLGVVNNTTGYWPHRLQYMMLLPIPTWLKTYVGGRFYKSLRRNYLKNRGKDSAES